MRIISLVWTPERVTNILVPTRYIHHLFNDGRPRT